MEFHTNPEEGREKPKLVDYRRFYNKHTSQPPTGVVFGVSTIYNLYIYIYIYMYIYVKIRILVLLRLDYGGLGRFAVAMKTCIFFFAPLIF